jgi:hypothetical protein
MREGKKREFLPVRGQWLDSYMYGILYDDFDMKSLAIL